MSTDKTAASPTLVGELFQAGIYKGSLGRITRRVTMLAILVTVAAGAYRWSVFLTGNEFFKNARYILPLALLAIGGWFAFRIVNYPRFADFLIAVEAEMSKVSWPSKRELYRSSFVVIFVLFFMMFVLYGFDWFWVVIFQMLGILQGGAAEVNS